MRCCHSTHGLLFRGSAGVTRGGQEQFATQTLRVHLLGLESLPIHPFFSETGRMQFPGARFQAPSSVSFCWPSPVLFLPLLCRNNRKGGTASLRLRTCVKRNRCLRCRVLRVFLCIFSFQEGNLIRIKTGLDTYLIRIQTRTPL